MRKPGTFQADRGPMNPTKPQVGVPSQATDPASDFASPNRPPWIVRYGPGDSCTDTPESRVATPGRVPSTGSGMTRYTATVDGYPAKTPRIDRAGKWEHNSPSFTHPDSAVASTGRSQNPKQARLTRTGKKTGD